MGRRGLRIEFAELIDLGEDVVVSAFEEAEIDFLLLDDESDNGVGKVDLALAATRRHEFGRGLSHAGNSGK